MSSFSTVGFVMSWRTMGFCTVCRINSGLLNSYSSTSSPQART